MQFSFFNNFSGQIAYESWTLSLYNVVFTVLPPLVIGIFDQFVSARILDRYPQLYTHGQKNEFFTKTSFWLWVCNALYHSLVSTCLNRHSYASSIDAIGHTDSVRLFCHLVLGRSQANLWTGYGPLVLGYHLVPRCPSHRPREGCFDFRVSSILCLYPCAVNEAPEVCGPNILSLVSSSAFALSDNL